MDDFGERLATVETEVEFLREHLVEIRAEQVRQRQSLDALRDHTDRGLADLRDHTDRGLEGIRREQARTTRWLVGLTITYGTAIVGMMAKMMGMF